MPQRTSPRGKSRVSPAVQVALNSSSGRGAKSVNFGETVKPQDHSVQVEVSFTYVR
jgi:hypothetical protein